MLRVLPADIRRNSSSDGNDCAQTSVSRVCACSGSLAARACSPEPLSPVVFTLAGTTSDQATHRVDARRRKIHTQFQCALMQKQSPCDVILCACLLSHRRCSVPLTDSATARYSSRHETVSVIAHWDCRCPYPSSVHEFTEQIVIK